MRRAKRDSRPPYAALRAPRSLQRGRRQPLVSTDMKELVSQRFGGFMDALTRDQVIALTTARRRSLPPLGPHPLLACVLPARTGLLPPGTRPTRMDGAACPWRTPSPRAGGPCIPTFP